MYTAKNTETKTQERESVANLTSTLVVNFSDREHDTFVERAGPKRAVECVSRSGFAWRMIGNGICQTGLGSNPCNMEAGVPGADNLRSNFGSCHALARVRLGKVFLTSQSTLDAYTGLVMFEERCASARRSSRYARPLAALHWHTHPVAVRSTRFTLSLLILTDFIRFASQRVNFLTLGKVLFEPDVAKRVRMI